MRDAIRVEPPSIQSLLLELRCGESALGTATGFVVKYGQQPLLVTNFHVLAGRDPTTGQPLSRDGWVPDLVRVHHLMEDRSAGVRWESRDEALFDDETGGPLWFEHPEYGRRVDVVALPLTSSAGAELHPYDLSEPAYRLPAGPSAGVSIVGFPFGKSAGAGFAIWTRGFIASEPEFDIDGLPLFYVDSRTRSGQSGSPVIVYHGGGPMFTTGSLVIGGGGIVVNFLGIYSGRINEKSDIGLVWKAVALIDIITGQVRGDADLVPKQRRA